MTSLLLTLVSISEEQLERLAKFLNSHAIMEKERYGFAISLHPTQDNRTSKNGPLKRVSVVSESFKEGAKMKLRSSGDKIKLLLVDLLLPTEDLDLRMA